MAVAIPSPWYSVLKDEIVSPYFHSLTSFVEKERGMHKVYPPESEMFAALAQTPPESVRVVLIGQDPYHGPGQAHGLCFSVKDGVSPPPSLRNLLKELKDDIAFTCPSSVCLEPWAAQGVLLLNTVLTVRDGEPNSHRGKGWEQFTDSIIKKVSSNNRGVVFILLGSAAARKRTVVLNPASHSFVEAPHPSPLSAHKGFFGSRIFTRTNVALATAGHPPIDWRLMPR